jgi:hypothetical protein
MSAPAWPRKGSHDHLPEGMVKLARAAEMLGVSRKAVLNAVKAGRLEKRQGCERGAILVTIASLRRFEAGEYEK